MVEQGVRERVAPSPLMKASQGWSGKMLKVAFTYADEAGEYRKGEAFLAQEGRKTSACADWDALAVVRRVFPSAERVTVTWFDSDICLYSGDPRGIFVE